MEPDEIVRLASTNVPESSHEECTRLTNDLWEYGKSHSVPAIFISKDTATKYQQSLECRTGVIACYLGLGIGQFGWISISCMEKGRLSCFEGEV